MIQHPEMLFAPPSCLTADTARPAVWLALIDEKLLPQEKAMIRVDIEDDCVTLKVVHNYSDELGEKIISLLAKGGFTHLGTTLPIGNNGEGSGWSYTAAVAEGRRLTQGRTPI